MANMRDFDINIFGLNCEKHDFRFEIDRSFFSLFDNQIVQDGKLVAEILLDKSPNMIEVGFELYGHVVLTCDRSLEQYEHKIDTDERIMFKYGPEYAELSEDVYVIPDDTQQINIGDYLFEFIITNIPMKKLHPRFQAEEEGEDEVVYTASTNDDLEEETNEEIDPRWKALQSLKGKDQKDK